MDILENVRILERTLTPCLGLQLNGMVTRLIPEPEIHGTFRMENHILIFKQEPISCMEKVSVDQDP